MNNDAQDAASSAVPDATPSFAEYEAAQNAQDRGITPEPTPKIDAPAESSPAAQAEPGASTEVKPEAASEAAKPRKTGEDRKRELEAEINDTLKRRAQIRDEIAREEARLQSLRQPPQETRPTPASEPAPAQATFPEDYDSFLAIDGNGEKSYETYIRELARFESDQRWAAKERETQDRKRQEHQQRVIGERDTKFIERLTAAGGKEFVQSCSPEVQGLTPFDRMPRGADGRTIDEPSGYNAIGTEIASSDVAPLLMRHFTDHPDDLHAMAKLPPDALFRAFGRLEARVGGTPAPAAPTPKTVSSAPPPPDTLGKRPASGADPVERAVASQDFGAYEREQNRRELAAGGRR